MYRLLGEPWKIAIVICVLVVGHFTWIWFSQDPTISQRFGAALIVLGIAVAARGLLREGIDVSVRRQMPKHPGIFLGGPKLTEEFHAHVTKVAPEIEKDVKAERSWGVWLIVVGTALTGYGDLLARAAGIGG